MSRYEHKCWYEKDGKIVDVYFDYQDQKSVEFERVDNGCYILNEGEKKEWKKYSLSQVSKNHIVKVKSGVAVATDDSWFEVYEKDGKLVSGSHIRAVLLSELKEAESLFMEQITKTMTKDEFKAKVEGRIFECVFLKKDGSERKMRATTDLTKVPDEFLPKQKEMTEEEAKKKAEKEEASPYVNVFDVEKNGWRKINLEKLISLDGEVLG